MMPYVINEPCDSPGCCLAKNMTLLFDLVNETLEFLEQPTLLIASIYGL
jgi:hypothetical protein